MVDVGHYGAENIFNLVPHSLPDIVKGKTYQSKHRFVFDIFQNVTSSETLYDFRDFWGPYCISIPVGTFWDFLGLLGLFGPFNVN